MRYDQVRNSAKTQSKQSQSNTSIQDLETNGWDGILHVVTGDNTEPMPLPTSILLENNVVMKLRKSEAVIRRHKFKNNDAHQYFFSELLLFWPHQKESQLFPNDEDACKSLYTEKADYIKKVKTILFPHLKDVEEGRDIVEKYNFDLTEKIGVDLDPEGQKANDDETPPENAEEYLGLDPEGLEYQNFINQNINMYCQHLDHLLF